VIFAIINVPIAIDKTIAGMAAAASTFQPRQRHPGSCLPPSLVTDITHAHALRAAIDNTKLTMPTLGECACKNKWLRLGLF
jgi:hypothetical protein